MRHPDSILPLWIASAIAVVLHAALLPVGASMLDRSGPRTPPQAELNVAFTAVPESAVVGQSPGIGFEITNTGFVEARGIAWSLYLSQDRQLDEADRHLIRMDDEILSQGGRGNVIAAGQTVPRETSFLIPEDTQGSWFVIAAASAENAPQTTAATALWIDSLHPALITIDAIDAPSYAYAGGTTSIRYMLHNHQDAGWAKAGWRDRVILSADDQVSGEDLVLLNVPRRRPLGPGASSESGPFELRLPLGVEPGEYRLIVESVGPERTVQGDVMKGTRQYAHHVILGWNATRSVPLRLEPATHPDLAPQNLKLSSGEAQLTLNQPTALSFDVTNRSPLAAPDLLWGDRVYWSVDDQVSIDDVLLVSEPRGAYPGELPGGGAYRSGPREIVITPEMVLSSTMHLIVVADDENDIAEGDYEGNNALALPIAIKQPIEAEMPDKLDLGRADEPARVTVAWIAHDDFQDLLARESVTLQPILQDKADPVPGAPLERDPQDTGTQAAVAVPPTPPTPHPADAPTPASQQVADMSQDPLPSDGPGDLPTSAIQTPGPVDQLGNAPQDTPGLPAPTPTPPQSAPESPPTVASQDQGDQPTSAPRSDREADPTQLINAQSIRPGQVLVGPGLEVKTFRPNWSAAALFTIPRNPRAVITFDLDGTVLQADLLTSTGFDNIDGPLLSSLYRWRATGKRLEDFTAPFQIEITILLNGNAPPEEESNEKDNP